MLNQDPCEPGQRYYTNSCSPLRDSCGTGLQGTYLALICCIKEIAAVPLMLNSTWMSSVLLVVSEQCKSAKSGFHQVKAVCTLNREWIKIPNAFRLALSVTTQTQKAHA